jgi:hypothetical protein
MQPMPGRPRGRTRLARALGLDGNPLCRASDRAEAWIRAGLIAVFLIVGPLAALGVGAWAYHAGPPWPACRPRVLADVMTLAFMALALRCGPPCG